MPLHATPCLMMQLSKTSVTEEPFPLVQAHIFAPIRGALYFQHLKKVK
jgi:hypothetical protein